MIFAVLVSLFVNVGPIQIIDGYTDKLSALPGDSVNLYLNASAKSASYTVRLYNLQGLVVHKQVISVYPQQPKGRKPYENGYDYEVSARIAVPRLKSGVYLWEQKIPFIIRTENPQIIVVYPSNTANAYCGSGGKSLYNSNSTDGKGAFEVSFLRPIPLATDAEHLFRWMELQPYKNVGYVSDMDLDDYKNMKSASLLIITGHSEYWTLSARRNFDKFIDEGKDAIVLSGNTMWWQVRYNEQRNQLQCYRSVKDDPGKEIKLKTINWNDVLLNYSILSSIGVDFSFAGYGLRYNDRGWDGYKIVSNSPLLEGTTLKRGDITKCPSIEVDGAPLSGFNSAGYPVINKQALGFERVELVGYDFVLRGGVEGVATWIVFKKTKTSGIIINTASMNWCSFNGMGSNGDLQKITGNMINKLLKKERVFSTQPDPVNAIPVN